MGDLPSSDQELPSDDEESSPRPTFSQYPENHTINIKFNFTAADGQVYKKKLWKYYRERISRLKNLT